MPRQLISVLMFSIFLLLTSCESSPVSLEMMNGDWIGPDGEEHQIRLYKDFAEVKMLASIPGVDVVVNGIRLPIVDGGLEVEYATPGDLPKVTTRYSPNDDGTISFTVSYSSKDGGIFSRDVSGPVFILTRKP